MKQMKESILKQKGYRLHVVQTNKFKTIHVVAKLKAPLSRDTITYRSLLPYVLQQGPKSYPTRKALSDQLDYLYGAVLSIDGAKKGENHIISFRLELANEKFIRDESGIFKNAMALFHDMIFNPNIEDGAFIDAIVKREKDTLRQRMSAMLDDKMSYANLRLVDEMCKDELYHLHVHGYEDDLDTISGENLYNYYQTALNEDLFDIYVLGDLEEETVKALFSTTFERERVYKEDEHIKQTKQKYEISEPKEIVEKQNVQQAKLHIGFRTNCTFKDKEYAAMQLFNGIFGGFPSSKLFLNVREKHSLAYYASSRLESHKGLLLVFSGIAPKDYEQARDVIFEQLEAMKNGEITEEEMKQTKELIVSQLLETLDHPQGIIEILYQQVIAQTTYSPEQLINDIQHVTKQDLVNFANQVITDTIYLLTAEGGDSHA